MAETTIKLGHVLSKDSHYGTAAVVFGAEVAKRTNGRYKVDGQENPIPVILSSKIYQVQKNLRLSNHVCSPALLLVSPKVWDTFSDADKAAFHEAVRIAVAANRKRVNDDEAKGIAQIKAAGVNVVEKVDNAAFLIAVSLAYTGYMSEFGVDNIKKIQNYK